MAKLKCIRHKARVHVFESGHMIHRVDGTRCEGVIARIGDRKLSTVEILDGGLKEPEMELTVILRGDKKKSTSPEKELLRDIFSEMEESASES